MIFRIFLLLGLSASFLVAQYRTESWEVRAGWNAIYLNIDVSDRSFDEHFAGKPDFVEVWQWRPGGLDPSLGAPGENTPGDDEWKVWRRGDLENSTFSIPAANAAYLVKLKAGAVAQTLSLKGKVVPPRVQWRSDGANLIGFPVKAGTTQQLNRYLGDAGLVDNNTGAFRYVGGPLNASNPVEGPIRLMNARRGEAFWIRGDKYTDFYGPVSVNVVLDQGLNYGTRGTLKRVTFKNRTTEEVTVNVSLAPSESAVDGTSVSPVVLTVRERDASSGLFNFVPLGNERTLTIPGNGSVGLSFGLDRAAMGGAKGAQFSGLLKVTDSRDYSEIYLPITAEKTDFSGLWIGEARIDRVQNQLQRFQRSEDGTYVVDEDGNYIPLGGDTGVNKTAQEFKIKLLVHVDATGKATLLNRVYAGIIADDGAGETLTGLSTSESSILPQHLKTAVRFSSSHFPSDLNSVKPARPDDLRGRLNGSLAPGSSLTTSIILGANDSSNPFLHTFHPDHDNKNARFDPAPLPEGIESHEVIRAITLAINATAGLGEGAQWGTTLLSGTFSETLTGIHKQPIAVSGIFALGKVSDIATLQNP